MRDSGGGERWIPLKPCGALILPPFTSFPTLSASSQLASSESPGGSLDEALLTLTLTSRVQGRLTFFCRLPCSTQVGNTRMAAVAESVIHFVTLEPLKVYICIYIHTYVHTHTHIYIHAHIYTFLY